MSSSRLPERVVVAHNAVGDQDDESTRDVLAQVELVVSGLKSLEVPHRVAAVADDIRALISTLEPGEVVFNLVEAPPGQARRQLENTEALERAGVPFTGACSRVIWLTTDKLVTREHLLRAGLKVAPGGRLDPDKPTLLDELPPPWILKPAWEDASIGLDGDPVCTDRAAALDRGRALATRFPDQPVLVEHFLPGREFNLAMLSDGERFEQLPLAEMVYEGFPPDVPRVLGWAAKWDYSSFAYVHTVRRFLDEGAEGELAADLRSISSAAWLACDLAGYARVDLRLDEDGVPNILEVNANPCLAADAGFMAAAGKAGLDAGQVVARILAAALARRTHG